MVIGPHSPKGEVRLPDEVNMKSTLVSVSVTQGGFGGSHVTVTLTDGSVQVFSPTPIIIEASKLPDSVKQDSTFHIQPVVTGKGGSTDADS